MSGFSLSVISLYQNYIFFSKTGSEINLLQNEPKNLFPLYSKIIRTVSLPVSYSSTAYSL